MEIWAANESGKLRSYLNQTEQANWTTMQYTPLL